MLVGNCNPALGRLTKDDCAFEASLGYITRHSNSTTTTRPPPKKKSPKQKTTETADLFVKS